MWGRDLHWNDVFKLDRAVVLTLEYQLENLFGDNSELLQEQLSVPVDGDLVELEGQLGQLVEGRVELIVKILRLDLAWKVLDLMFGNLEILADKSCCNQF